MKEVNKHYTFGDMVNAIKRAIRDWVEDKKVVRYIDATECYTRGVLDNRVLLDANGGDGKVIFGPASRVYRSQLLSLAFCEIMKGKGSNDYERVRETLEVVDEQLYREVYAEAVEQLEEQRVVFA